MEKTKKEGMEQEVRGQARDGRSEGEGNGKDEWRWSFRKGREMREKKRRGGRDEGKVRIREGEIKEHINLVGNK